MNKFSLYVLLVIAISINSFSQTNTSYYLGQLPPGNIPEIFAPGIISLKNRLEVGCSFSADIKEFAFTINGNNDTLDYILYCENTNNIWSTPIPIPFVGLDSISSPVFSPDGMSMTFSKTPLNASKSDIWICNKTDNGWSSPQCIPSPISSQAREAGNGFTLNRTLYFTSNRDSTHLHTGDIYRSKLTNGKYLTVEKVEGVNTSADEDGLYISPEEDFILIHTWQKRSQGYDIYISYNRFDNTWSKPEKLDSTINTINFELNPIISPDKKFIFFSRMFLPNKTREIEADLYWSNTKKIFKPYIFHSISDTIISTGTIFKYTIPDNTFKDIDGTRLTLNATLSNGDKLPEWLKFQNAETTFSGTPKDTGNLSIKIIAIDEEKNIALTEFKIMIK